jgi:VanZ family protein
MSMKRLLWVIAEIAIVFILLSLPGSSFPDQAKWYGNFPLDKLVHILLFGSLALSFLIYFEKSKYQALKTVRAKAYVLIFCILYGIGMEYYQKYFVPSRGFEVGDMLADAIGSLLALPLLKWLKGNILNKHK